MLPCHLGEKNISQSNRISLPPPTALCTARWAWVLALEISLWPSLCQAGICRALEPLILVEQCPSWCWNIGYPLLCFLKPLGLREKLYTLACSSVLGILEGLASFPDINKNPECFWCSVCFWCWQASSHLACFRSPYWLWHRCISEAVTLLLDSRWNKTSLIWDIPSPPRARLAWQYHSRKNGLSGDNIFLSLICSWTQGCLKL